MAIRADEVMLCNGRLSQIGVSFCVDRHRNRSAVFLCDCGERFVTSIKNVKSWHTTSCGCYDRERRTTHGKARTPVYRAWYHMIARCANTNDKRYGDYGGRGISVCDRWLKFENFLADMVAKPDGLSIDRIDNNGNYCPENCRWATNNEQARNTRRTIMVPVNGVLMCAKDAAAAVGMRPNTLMNRIRQGWTPERAISTPVRGSN